jgi:hypothetical protein
MAIRRNRLRRERSGSHGQGQEDEAAQGDGAEPRSSAVRAGSNGSLHLPPHRLHQRMQRSLHGLLARVPDGDSTLAVPGADAVRHSRPPESASWQPLLSPSEAEQALALASEIATAMTQDRAADPDSRPPFSSPRSRPHRNCSVLRLSRTCPARPWLRHDRRRVGQRCHRANG